MKTLILGQNATKICLICAFMTKMFADTQNTIALPLIITHTIIKNKIKLYMFKRTLFQSKKNPAINEP